MTKFERINEEQVENVKRLISHLDDVFSNDAVMLFAYPFVEIPNGMSLRDVSRTELISYALAIGNADGEISQQEADLLNVLFDVEGDPVTYKGIADSMSSTFLSVVPNWVRAFAAVPNKIVPAEFKVNLIGNLTRIMGQIVSLVDGVSAVELATIEQYTQMCEDYIKSR